MIPQITEVNFPEYATLHQATVSFETMGERTITTQIRVDGDIVPELGVTEGGVFKPMELEYRGERFVLPTLAPQSKKDNTSRNSLIDLTFQSWAVYQLKRYFFVEMASITSGTAIADKYQASLTLTLPNFVDALNLVLDHYFNGSIQASLFGQSSGIYSTDPVTVDISYTKIWDVLQSLYKLYGYRWWIEYDDNTQVYYIKIGYESPAITDHEFTYGYEGGLVSFERQADDDITNIILGRGGDKNLPYRYFKEVDSENPSWTADPDAIPELANIYFDRLRDINFRWYVRGWMQNSNRDTSWDSTHTFPTYSSIPEAYQFAYDKGRTDSKFNPVEYVKDDNSIATYGEMWGALDDNDDIYPSIQGVTVSPYGRVDEAVGISQIVTDDITEYTKNAAIERTIGDVTHTFYGSNLTSYVIYSDVFTIASGDTGNITYRPLGRDTVFPNYVSYDTTNTTIRVVDASGTTESSVPSSSFDDDSKTGAISGIPAGTWRLKVNLVIKRVSPATAVTGTFGIENVVLTTASINTNAWKPTFDIWVKNIWGTTQGSSETDTAYSERVWAPILGDRVGNEAKVVFSSGPLSISQDYEFVIASYPVPDRTKTYNGVSSEWKITVYKSSAEFQSTGLYIPNASSAQPTAGNTFFFTGIDMPFQYVMWAEERLNSYKASELEETAEVAPTWTLRLDKVRVHTLEEADYGNLLADRLDSGVLIKTSDPRFTNGNILSLYIQSITWTWNEPSEGSPYLVPDIEVILSDKVVAVESPLAKLENEVEVISESYVQTPDVESVVRRIAGALYLKKTGESDTSDSPTSFSSKVSSKDFRKGDIGGSGWGFYADNSEVFDVPAQSGLADDGSVNTRSVLEVDKLVVRDELHVNELVVNQISYQGGKEIISAAAMEVSMVRETSSSYICYFDQKQGTIANLFKVNDIAYGQVWNADDTELRTYKMVVTAVDDNSITLSKSSKYGAGIPQMGDVIVQYGNTTNSSRQYIIVRDVIGGGYEKMISGLNSTTATGTEYYFAGRESNSSPRWFVGERTGEYAEWANGELNIKGGITVTSGSSGMSNFSEYSGLDSRISSVTNNLTTFLQTTYPLDKQGLQDGMIQTYYDANTPTWTDDNSKHVGDIWYDQTNQITKRFSEQYTWEPLTDGTAVTAEALARTKCRVFYGQPTVPYSQNDLWLNNGRLYRAKTGRTTGDFTSTEWEEAILINANDKAEVQRVWQQIHGAANLGTATEAGSYITTKNIAAKAGYGSEEDAILVYNGNILTYDDNTLVYKASGTAALDNAYNALKSYLTTAELYDDNTEWAGAYDAQELTRLLTAYYTAQTSFLANAQFSLVSEFDYLKGALRESSSTEIGGGVVLSSVLGVRNGNGNVTAGMDGTADDDSPMLWAGSSNAQTRGNAKWKVYKDGKTVLTDANGSRSTIIDGNEYDFDNIFGTDTTGISMTGGSSSATHTVATEYSDAEFTVETSRTLQSLTVSKDGTFAFPSFTLSGAASATASITLNLWYGQVSLCVDGVPIATLSETAGSASFSQTFSGVQMFLTAGTHSISIVGEFNGQAYADDERTATFTATVGYSGTGTHIVEQKVAYLCANGFIIGESSASYMKAEVDTNGMNYYVINGDAGVQVYNDTLKLRIGGTWYTASIDNGYLKLT